jgi:phosphatidylglycerophosphate synthase
MTDPLKDRRPLASRQSGWARNLSRWLAATSVTPNQISAASMVASALAGAAFWAVGSTEGAARIMLLLAAAAFCQARLVCNLLDGMVAVEGGKSAPDGPFWNEFPDRISDIVIFAGVGFGLCLPGLGWAAASFAVLTAYTRELGSKIGAPADFSGPMAKQHRMAVITAAAVLSVAEPLAGWQGWALTIALLIIAVGAAFTALGRAARLVTHLKR